MLGNGFYPTKDSHFQEKDAGLPLKMAAKIEFLLKRAAKQDVFLKKHFLLEPGENSRRPP
jgi:hypothetical protein